MSIPRFAGEQLSFDPPGYLFFGDNLEVLRRHLPDESVDLIYLDPPFNSAKSYNLLFEHRDGSKAAGQQKAFDDTWRWTLQSARLYEEIVSGGGATSAMLRGMREMIGTTDMLAYLTMMTPRLIELHRVLKPNGGLYLHCDSNASHYIKVMLDSVFGAERFQSEIAWKRTHAHGNAGRNYAQVCDTLLFYTKGDDYTWNQPYIAYSPEYLKRFTGVDPDGRCWQSVTIRNPSPRPNLRYDYTATNGVTYKPHANGWAHDLTRMKKLDAEDRLVFPARATGQLRVKAYLDESRGVKATNFWDDIYPVNSQAAERLGYPTQKPLALLERIISASSNTGDVVLDPFCGCGTAVDAAQKLDRRWIGIDITQLAVEVICDRMKKQFPDAQYVLGGEPATAEEAEVLAAIDKYEFQRWALERIGISKPIKKGADRGIDGEIVGTYEDGRAWRAIVSVKGGGISVNQVRDLVGTITREKAEIGIFVTLKPPTPSMKREAADAGFTETGQPRLQILTIADLFDGRKIELPTKRKQQPKVVRLRLAERPQSKPAERGEQKPAIARTA